MEKNATKRTAGKDCTLGYGGRTLAKKIDTKLVVGRGTAPFQAAWLRALWLDLLITSKSKPRLNNLRPRAGRGGLEAGACLENRWGSWSTRYVSRENGTRNQG